MWSLCFVLLSLYSAHSQLIVGGIGDDISTALNANSLDITTTASSLDFPAQTVDQSCGRSNPGRSWGAMIDSSYDSILSYAEQAGAVGAQSEAVNGASMLSGFASQATSLATFLKQGQTSRAIILIGHADMCTSQTQKSVGSCASADQDPQNYCRTTTQAFEREFRKGLDQLISLNNLEIVVFAPLRYSQICNFKTQGYTVESLYGANRSCGQFWSDMASGTPFGFGPCASLTSDCSSDRVRDAYNTQLSYFNILKTVTTNYKPGTGVVAGNGTKITFRDDLWNVQFQPQDISACDCFHPSKLMESRIANITSGTLQCSSASPCCDANFPETCQAGSTIGSGAPALSQSLLLGLCLLFLIQLFY